MKGICIGVPGGEDHPVFLRVIEEGLAKHGFDTLVLLIRYAFPFKSHPGVAEPNCLTATQFRDIALACRRTGIRLIPKMNLMGHQSGKERGTEAGLLRAYPHFDETPDLDSVRYCRSLCPRHPEVLPVVCDLIDEMIDLFEADAFHVGCDEVFEIGHCPRCRNVPHAELFADWIVGLYDHIVGRRKAEMLMWADRLLDAATTGYGEWEASMNATHPAVDLIPSDIICCDWHYTMREDYPSVPFLTGKGFRTVVCPWRNVEATNALLAYAGTVRSEKLSGVLQTSWCDSGDLSRAILGEAPFGAATSGAAANEVAFEVADSMMAVSASALR